MFFRTETAKKTTFQDYLTKAKDAGFTVAPLGGTQAKVSRKNVTAIVEDVPGCPPKMAESPGIAVGAEIARLVDGGYQKFIVTPSGKKRAALASDLRDIHAFDEDLREGLGLTSLYNLSLGTTSDEHLYDRVEDRDDGPHVNAWDKH